MRKVCFYLLFLSLIFCSFTTVFAARFDIENGKVYGHKTLNDEIVFFTSNQNYPSLFHAAHSEFYLQKVFPQVGESYYYCYINVVDSKFKNLTDISINFYVNNNEIKLTPYENLEFGHKNKKFSGWYKLEQVDIDAMLDNLQSMAIKFTSNSKIVKEIKVYDKRIPAFTRLAKIKKEDYIREGIIFEKAKDSIKDIISPQVYIPNVKPEQIQWSIFKNITEKSKDKDSPYHISDVWQGDNPLMFALEGCENIDGSNSYLTFVTTPYKDGILFKMYKNQKRYSSHKTKYGTEWSTDLRKMVESYGGIVNMCDYWRSISDDWDNLFIDVYHDLYGDNNYGFDCSEKKAKDGNGNTFYITNIHKDQFPELAIINEKDILKSIDEVDTAFMRYMDIKYKLAINNKPINIVVVNSMGQEKNICITPKFKPADLTLIGSESPLEKMKRSYESKGLLYDENNAFIFEPIEPRLENKIETEDQAKANDKQSTEKNHHNKNEA